VGLSVRYLLFAVDFAVLTAGRPRTLNFLARNCLGPHLRAGWQMLIVLLILGWLFVCVFALLCRETETELTG